MQQTENRQFVRIDSLTWMRGIAAFLVVIYHVKRATNVSYFGADAAADFNLMEWLDVGNFGVLMFFVISGTTLYLNHQRLDSLAEVGRFFIKRLFRIWPAFFVSMLVFMAFVPLFRAFYLESLAGHWIEVHARGFDWSEVLLYLGLVFNLTGPPQVFNIVYWSLPIEFQYYLLFPLLLLSLRWLSIAGPVLIGGLIYLGFSLDLGAYIANAWTLLFAYTFCGGVLVGNLFRRFGKRFELSPWLALALIMPLVAILSLLESGIAELPAVIQQIPIVNEPLNWQGFGAIFIVAVILFTRAPRGFRPGRGYRLLMHYGEVSYSVYLYHMLLIAFSVLLIINLDITGGLTKLLFTLALALPGSFWLADLSYRWVEKRGINYGRAVIRGLKRGRLGYQSR